MNVLDFGKTLWGPQNKIIGLVSQLHLVCTHPSGSIPSTMRGRVEGRRHHSAIKYLNNAILRPLAPSSDYSVVVFFLPMPSRTQH